MDEANNIIYKESQRFKQGWLWVLVIIISSVAIYGFIQQIIYGVPFGNRPAPDGMMYFLLILMGIIFPIFFYNLKLITTIYDDRIEIRFYPFMTKTIELSKITSFKAVTYRPIRDCGGWGVRWYRKGGTAYTVSGNKGLELTLNGAKKKLFLIGTNKPQEIETVLRGTINRINS